MKSQLLLLLLIPGFLLSACSDSSENSVGEDHVWKEQTETIDKARKVEGMLKQAAETQKKAIEEQM